MGPATAATAGGVLILSFLILLKVHAVFTDDDDRDLQTTVIRPPHLGGDRHTVLLPLFLSHTNSSSDDYRRRLQSPGESRPNAQMDLHNDLLLNGYYTAWVWIGTPPQKFALIIDTGSTVTYVPCFTCEQCGKHQDPKFQPELSSTYQPVKCNIDCTCDPDRVQCVYERSYAEMSSSSGVLGEDIISFGNQSELKPHHAIFGCENVETGDLYSQNADGIMGLGRGDLSIVDQLVGKGVISDSFSLCYGGMDVGGGTMVLGGISAPKDMVFAHSDPGRSPYYNIDLKEIHVAGKALPLSSSAFDGKHGTVLDSGTTYAYLPEAAFAAFKEAIMTEIQSLKRIRGPDPNYNDICFSVAESDVAELSKTFPSVGMVFGTGQKLSLSPENYLFQTSDISTSAPSISSGTNSITDMVPSLSPSGTPPSLAPTETPPSLAPARTFPPVGIKVGKITFYMSSNVNISKLKPHISELSQSIAQQLGVNIDQVHLVNFTFNGNRSLMRWAILPAGSAVSFANATAIDIISRLGEHRVQLPKDFGNYELFNWNAEPPPKRTWWQLHYLSVIATIVVIVILGLSALGAWFIWRNRQQSVISYKPVDSVVPEQELQPIQNGGV